MSDTGQLHGNADVLPRAAARRPWPASSGERVKRLAHEHRLLLGLLAAGAAVRLLSMILYSSVVLIYYGGDSTRYARLAVSGYHGLFSDPDSPAGYPAFLGVARSIDRNIAFTITLQHLMGLATAVFLYAIVRGLTRSNAWACLPAAVVLLSGDVVFLETALLTETLWMLLLAAGMWACVNARGRRRPYSWLCAGAVLLSLAGLVRSLSLPLIVLAALWALWEIGGGWRRRVGVAACFLAPAAILLGSYALVASAENGYAGLSDMSGFNLYARVGQFADCSDFTPPRGTAGLCESTPSSQRPGPYFYTYGQNAPMYRAGFGADPASSKKLGEFADEAILNQPGEYLAAVIKDLGRYIAPDAIVARPDSGIGPPGMSFASASPANQGQSPAQLAGDFDTAYSGVSASVPSQGVRELLGGYQEVLRLNGFLVVLLTVTAAAGLLLGRGASRRAGLLFLLMGLYLYIVPVALSSYDVRYGVPAGMFMAVSAALAACSITARVRERRSREVS